MTGLSFTAIASLFCIQAVLCSDTRGQETGICSTAESRRAAVKEVVGGLDCDDYNCVSQKLLQPGLHPLTSAKSCAEILNNAQNSSSGYYWLQSATGSAVHVYCDMSLTCKGVDGGWMQVAKLDMTNSSHQCPPGTRLRNDLLESHNKRLCGINFDGAGCSTTIFAIHGIEYRHVCGKITAYQDASPDAFGAYNVVTRNNRIDGNYIDGISLTHGSNPREHIWTFAAALDEVGDWFLWKAYCSCTNVLNSSISYPPNFVGNDYFCDTGSAERWQHRLYADDPLWDGAGCGANNTCCSLNNPPWFLKQLPSNTTDDIEMRMCRDQSTYPSINHQVDEGTPIEILQLYVR